MSREDDVTAKLDIAFLTGNSSRVRIQVGYAPLPGEEFKATNVYDVSFQDFENTDAGHARLFRGLSALLTAPSVNITHEKI